jgi:hypothetical protein
MSQIAEFSVVERDRLPALVEAAKLDERGLPLMDSEFDDDDASVLLLRVG